MIHVCHKDDLSRKIILSFLSRNGTTRNSQNTSDSDSADRRSPIGILSKLPPTRMRRIRTVSHANPTNSIAFDSSIGESTVSFVAFDPKLSFRMETRVMSGAFKVNARFVAQWRTVENREESGGVSAMRDNGVGVKFATFRNCHRGSVALIRAYCYERAFRRI